MIIYPPVTMSQVWKYILQKQIMQIKQMLVSKQMLLEEINCKVMLQAPLAQKIKATNIALA